MEPDESAQDAGQDAHAVLDMTPDQIRDLMDDWKFHYSRRDDLVRAARAAGIQIQEIADRMGLSRVTVYAILRKSDTAT